MKIELNWFQARHLHIACKKIKAMRSLNPEIRAEAAKVLSDSERRGLRYAEDLINEILSQIGVTIDAEAKE